MRKVRVLNVVNPQDGWFHQFAMIENAVLAIVELEDGNIITPYADQIQFIHREKKEDPYPPVKKKDIDKYLNL